MLGLEDEVVVFVRCELLGDACAGAAGGKRMLDDLAEVGAPLAAVVVGVDHRHASSPAPCLELGDMRHDGSGMRQQRGRAVEGPLADHVDDEQGGVGSVRQ